MTRKPHLLMLGLILMCGTCRAEELGRLFFWPQERLDLDRHGVRRSSPSIATPPSEPGSLRLDGVVRRSDGSATIWINGRPAPPSEARRFADNTGAAVKLPDGRQARLKVGNTLPLATPDNGPPETRK